MISQTNDLNQIVVCDCDEVLVNITPNGIIKYMSLLIHLYHIL